GSSWQFSLADLYRKAKARPTGALCDTTTNAGSGTWSGTITAPSGASAQFTVAPELFGRSEVVRSCWGDDPATAIAREPYLFAGMAMDSKIIIGPGLPSGGLVWTYDYGPPNHCWKSATGAQPGAVQCTTASPRTRTTTVTAPDGAVSRYTYSNR